MIERTEIDRIFCGNIEFFDDRCKVVSYSSIIDPVIDIRYDRIPLRDSFEHCLVEIEGAEKNYIIIKILKAGIVSEISLIKYEFKSIEMNLSCHKNNHLEGLPYFRFNQIDRSELTHYKLKNSALDFLKYTNALAIKFFSCELDHLYWIKTDNIYFGLNKNELLAVIYDIPDTERAIYKLL